MAGARIAGITIEIGGDATKLKSALKGVDGQLSATQRTLKDINGLLKLDPSNVTLLKQKQTNLNKAIETTKTRLDQLKAAQTEDLSPEEWDALQREIIETEGNLKDLKEEQKRFGSVANARLKVVGDKLQSIGDKCVDVGKNLTTYITAPIIGVGIAAYAAFNEVDAGEDAIIKKTGATGEALESMVAIMEEIATEIPVGFESAGNAVGEVNTKFGVTGSELKALTTKFLQFSEINDTDVVTSIDGVQSALAAFGEDASSAGTYLGKLTDVSQRYGISTDTLTGLVADNAATFKSLHMSLYDANEFLGKVSVSGADANTVMSAMSKALKNATENGIPLDKALEDLQNTILNGKDGTDGLTASYDLFGKSGAAVYEAVRNGTIDFTNLNGIAKETGNIVADTFNATLDPADNFQVALNKVKVLGKNIAERVMPVLADVIERVSGFVDKATAKWDSFTDAQKDTILKIVGVVAAIGPLLVVGGKVVSGIGKITSAISAAGGLIQVGQNIINLIKGPVGIIAAIGLLITAGTWIVNNWDTIKAKAIEIWEKIKAVFNNAWKAISGIDWAGLGATIWNGIKDAFKSVVGWFKEKFINVKNAIATVDWGTLGSTIWNAIKAKFANVKDWFVNKFKAAVNAVIGLLNTLIGKAESAINKVVNGINKKLTVNVDFGNLPKFLGGGSLGGIHWAPNIPTAQLGRIKYLAQGGILGNGGTAIVGEYAPEMLRVVNGRAIVTPLSDTPGRMGGTVNNTFNIYAQPGQDARQIAAEVQRIMVREARQRGAAYA